MKTTGIFTIHREEMVLPFGKKGKLIPFGDIHRHAPNCDVDRWLAFVEMCQQDDQYTRYIGMGDYEDFASATERIMFDDSRKHESTAQTLDEMAQKFLEELAEELSFAKGRLLGLVEGNHYWKFTDGTTSTQRLCRLLGCKYLGVSAFIQLRLVCGTKHNTENQMTIWAHHGLGAARLVGGSVNKVEQMRETFPMADVYLMGHDHKRGAWPVSVLELTSTRFPALRYRKQWLCRTGSFLRGYVAGNSSYIVDRAIPPTDIGAIRLEFERKRIRHAMGEKELDYTELDVHCWA